MREPFLVVVLLTLFSPLIAGEKVPSTLVEGSRRKAPGEHWAYHPPSRPEVPIEDGARESSGAIDAFLASRQRELGVTPLGRVSGETLLRRVYLDLIGLPPTREERRAFLEDSSPSAYENVVDRLLASPQYAERWARHWMDVWRYSDWTGFGNEIRYSQRHIWRWRDWIIESLAADKGYDRMILEMLAADELAPGDDEALRATGFLARNWYKFDRNAWLNDSVEHTFKAFVGVTVNCARCHDHKYDPISQAEYYAVRAIFEPYDVRTDRIPGELNVDEDGLVRAYDARCDAPTYLFDRGDPRRADKEHPIEPGVPAVLGSADFEVRPLPLPVESYYPALRSFVVGDLLNSARAAVSAAEAACAQANAALTAVSATDSDERAWSHALARRKLETARANLASLEARWAAERAKYLGNPSDPPPGGGESGVSLDDLSRRASSTEREAVLARARERCVIAEYELSRVERRHEDDDAKSRQALEAARKTSEEARKELAAAQAKAQEESTAYTPLGPLYPRSSSGRRLALARWIASRENPLTARVAVNHIWLRHFGAPLVDSVVDFGLRSPRPLHGDLLDYLAVELMENGWSTKHLHRLIVTSEAYRRRSTVNGASPKNTERDPQNRTLWRMNARRMEAETIRDAILHAAGSLDLRQGGPEIDHGQGLTSPRRSLYFQHARQRQMRFLTLFDAANPRECYRRRESIRPQQAFALLNSSLVLAQSIELARILHDASENDDSDAGFVRSAFETILSRSPGREELAACCEFLVRQRRQLAVPENLTPLAGTAETLRLSNDPGERAHENLVLVLFNHHDFVTIR